MQYFGSAHWLVPWFILLVGLYSIIRFARGYLNEATFTATDRRLMSVFVGLLDLQATTGLIYFLWRGSDGMHYSTTVSVHAIIMFIAAVIPHSACRLKAVDNPTRYLNNFYIMLASLLLMLVGLSFIPPN